MIAMKLHVEHNLTFGHFEQMEALEAACYSAEYIAPAHEAFSWYESHPHSVLAACEDGRVVGFVNLLPVRPTLFARICDGSFNDAGMTADDILSLEECAKAPFELFLSCIAVDGKQRGTGLARTLVATALAPYLSPAFACEFVVTDNVTEDGERFSKRLGFKLVCDSDHGTKVYRHTVRDLAAKLNEAPVSRLG